MSGGLGWRGHAPGSGARAARYAIAVRAGGCAPRGAAAGRGYMVWAPGCSVSRGPYTVEWGHLWSVRVVASAFPVRGSPLGT